MTSPRFAFLDGLRALAILLMVVNHTARWWIGVPMGPARYRLVYASMLLAAPIFLLLVGFVLPLSTAARAPGGRGAGLRHALRRGGRLLLAGWLLNVLVFPHDPWRLSGVLHTIGLGVVAGALALPLARTPRGPALLVAVAAALYATFVAAFPALAGWAARHPGAAPVVFGDFRPGRGSAWWRWGWRSAAGGRRWRRAFHGWAAYAAANVVLVGVLIALARLWLAVRPRLGPRAPAAAAA